MNLYEKNSVIFRQGDEGECMYSIRQGRVGIFIDYGTPEEKKLTELGAGDFFGEMGMIDHAARSATAVALEDWTGLNIITENDLENLFKEDPTQVLLIMQHLSAQLRRLTHDYMDACRTAANIMNIEEKNSTISDAEMKEIQARIDYYTYCYPCVFGFYY